MGRGTIPFAINKSKALKSANASFGLHHTHTHRSILEDEGHIWCRVHLSRINGVYHLGTNVVLWTKAIPDFNPFNSEASRECTHDTW